MSLASPQSVLGWDYLITQLSHIEKQQVTKSKQDLLEPVWKCGSSAIKVFSNTYNWILAA